MLPPFSRIFRRSALLSGVALGSLALGLAGCSGAQKVAYARAYPGKPQSGSVDVQVRRDETRISLINTSARAFPASTLWINAQYSKPIGPLAVGQAATFELSDFRNEFSEPFRAGGFFATEKPDVVVQAQLELEEEMVGFVVVQGKER